MTKTFSCLLCNLLLIFAQCENSDLHVERTYRFQSSITIDGRERTFIVNLPPDYYENSGPLPLVIGLHGTGGSAEQFERDYGLTQRADNFGFIVVYPNGVRSDGTLKLRTWNAGACCDYAIKNNIDDVKFIRELISQLISDYKVNFKKVYVTGMSNGGMMAYRLACEIPDKIAAIAPVSCSMMVKKYCNPSRPVPILHIHSALDEKIPYSGGVGLGAYYYPPIDSVLRIWSSNNVCADAEVLVDDNRYKHTRSNCAGTVTIECYVTQDGGHSWPGGLKPRDRSDEPSVVINASDLIFDFFKRYELP